MASKYQLITRMAEEVAVEIGKSPANWTSFLTTAANNYKYRFKDQLLIYAQKPDATACAEIETWNKLGRWVNKGTKGIALLVDVNGLYRLRHVFDLSDTNSKRGRNVSLWQMKPQYEGAVIEALSNSFGDIEEGRDFTSALITTAFNVVKDNITDYYESLCSVLKSDDPLCEYDEASREGFFNLILTGSVAHMALTRCGYDAAEYIPDVTFQEIGKFSSPEIMAILGGATSDISEMVLRDIAETVKIAERNEKSINRTFAKVIEMSDNVVTKKTHERSDRNERTDLHEEGRLSDPGSGSTGESKRTWQVWDASSEVPSGEEGRDLHRDAADGQVGSAPAGDRPSSDRNDGRVDEEDGEAGRRIGETEGRRSDALGTTDEQHSQLSGGNGTERTGLPLSGIKDLYRSEYDYFYQDDEKNELIRSCPALKEYHAEIAAFFRLHEDRKECGDFVRSFFDNEPFEMTFEDGTTAGLRAYEDCLHLWRGHENAIERETRMEWHGVANHIYGMMLIREWTDNGLPVFPTEDEQIQMVENAGGKKNNQFAVPQEAIDYILAGGGTYSGSKFRIYEQYLKNEGKEKNIAMLKADYGIGGHNDAIPGTGYYLSHDGKGIEIQQKIGGEKFLLKWPAVEKRIGQLIAANRYLSEKDKELYAKWKEDKAEQAKRNAFVTEFDSICQDFNDFERQLGNESVLLNLYVLSDCSRQFVQGKKTTYLTHVVDMPGLKDNNFVLPLMRDAMQKIIAENTHLTERAEKMLEILNSDIAKPLEPTKDELSVKKDYVLSLGDVVFIGNQQYEILSLDDPVLLFDENFPILNKEMPRDEFYRKVRENPTNDKYFKVIEPTAEELLSEYIPTTEYKDAFFVSEIGKSVVWITHEDNRYIRSLINFEHIEAASINRTDVDSFFDALSGYARVEIYESGTEDFDSITLEFNEKPTFTELTEATMNGLLDSAGLTEKLEPYDREMKILYDVFDRLKIEDIGLSFDENGIVAKDRDNEWHGEEFYHFLADEAIVWNEDGSALGIEAETISDFKSLCEHHGVLCPVSKLSVVEQYQAEKEKHPNEVVLLRVGDFWEVMGDDAKKVADTLSLMLTYRNVDGERFPMCGFPVHVTEKYTDILENAGYTLVFCSDDKETIAKKPRFEIHTIAVPDEDDKFAVFDNDTNDFYLDSDNLNHWYDTEKEALEYLSDIQKQISMKTALDKAKNLINDFSVAEYGEEADFSDLSKIGIAYTETPDENIPIQVNIDLVHYSIDRYIGGLHLDTWAYDSLEQLIDTQLVNLDFADLTDVTDEQIEHYLNVETVVKAIREYQDKEFHMVDPGDLENLESVPLAYSDPTEDSLDLQVSADLERLTVYCEYGGTEYTSIQFKDAEDMADFIRNTTYDELLDFAAKEHAKQVSKEAADQAITVTIPFSEHHAFYKQVQGEDGIPALESRFDTLSFPVANRLLGMLDMKQHNERNSKDIGWYHKTDFVIKYYVDGEKCTYEGRYDLGDGETDLLTHIKNTISYYEQFYEKQSDGAERKEEWHRLYETLIPLLEANTELTESDIAYIDTVMATEPEWYPEKEVAELEAPHPVRKEKVAPHILYPEIKSDDRINFKITDDDIGVGTPSERYRHNIEAIRLLKRLEQEKRLATPEEQEVLSQYVGWGGLSDCFKEGSPQYAELKELLTDEEFASASESTLTAFYTPPVVIRSIYQALENMNFKVGNILEPSCGVGNFMGMLPAGMNESKIYGIELDSITGRIAQQLYQKNSIAVQGFETTNLPDSFFDAAVGNVPFGDFKVLDKRYDKHNFFIHDYFFARTLDKVRPGGIIAFITSKGTLDKENPAVRKYIAQRADLLGAIRLPNNTFKDAAGTKVTSDIIFLQKRDRLIDHEPDWVHIGKDENGIAMNQYFIDNPVMVLGEMRMTTGIHGAPMSTCVPYENAELSELLTDAIQNIHAEVTEYEFDDVLDEDEDFSIPADPDVRNFSFTIVDGKVYYRENSVMYPKELSVTAENRIKGMIGIRDCVRRLIEYQTEDYSDSEIKAEQEKLNELYDAFSKKYGIINSRANSSVFSDDSSYCLLCSLEVLDDEGNFVRKADMFSKRTIRQRNKVSSVDTASEALSVSLSEKAKVDMSFMTELTGKSEQELYEELKGVIFLNPMHSDMMGQPKYVTADEYLSGNVREKLATAKKSQEAFGADYAPNVEALTAVQPVDLTASEISIRLGATWLPPEVVEAFMFELFDTPRYCRWNIHVHFSEYSGEWNIEGKSYDRSNVKAYNTYGTSRINGYKIIEDTLNLRDVKIFDYEEDENGRRVPVLNRKETAIAQGKQELIKQAFQDWIWKDPERREMLCKLYNEKFNSFRAREYNGDFLQFVGMNPEITLRKHQVDAIARILLGGNSLLAHVVGGGKTFEMVAAAQESKRLGLCQKSLFVVPNHLTEQWAAEYLQLYPSANILVATKKDFETKNRKKFCARIATGDYDAVIIGHSQFEKIPMSVERQRIILERQLDEIIEGIAEVKRNHGDNFSIKQLEKSKKAVKQKLEKLNDQSRKDDVVTFEELGVDRLFIDEAHYYKNLAAFSKMRNVGGISQTEAMKSSDLYMKCRYLDDMTGGKGVVFATGTPISNSMVEMYTMQKYLQYNALKRNRLLHFDSWASTFGETVTAIELAPEGTGYRAKTRFAKFYNLPELIMMFREIADIQTADMLKLPVPKANYHTVALKPSEQQKEMVESLSERAEKVRNKMVSSNEDNMLVITNDGRKLALDQRLMNELLPDSETSKVSACAENVFDIWQRTAEQRSTQMVFCDLSTPHGDDKFNVYDALRSKLIEKGIPEDEIAFIHDAKTEVQKKEMFGKVRNGQIRVILGSTSKMGAGTNVQKKLIALHHLDCPWRPADLQQREGRIIRQGNENPEVEIYTYVTENTFDAYLYQLVESKQKFIGQIMTSKSPVRSADDVDEQALSYAEIKALASGNPHIKEKMDLDIEVSRLKLLKSNHLSQKYSLEDQILKEFPQKIKALEERIKGFDKDIAHAAEHTHPNADGFSPMTIKGTLYTEKKEAGEAIIAACKSKTNPDPTPLGEYRGFSMELAFDSFSREYQIILKNELRHTVPLGTDIFGNILRLDNAINAFSEKQIACKEQLEGVRKQLANAKVEVEKPFPHEEALQQKMARLSELNALLNMDKRENEIDDGERSEDEPDSRSNKDRGDAR